MNLRERTGRRRLQLVRPLRSLGLTLGAILLAATAARAAAASMEILVCPTCHTSSLKEAVREARAGSKIVVRGGYYREGNIVVDKSLRIVGEQWPVLDGGGEAEVLTVIASDVEVSGLVIENSAIRFSEDPAGIKVRNAQRCTIRDNRLLNDFFAIYLAGASDCVVSGNQVRGRAGSETISGNAIHLWNCRRILVKDNRVSGHRDGLYFEFLRDSTIVGNLSERNVRYGMHTMYSSDNNYSANTLRDNKAGEVLMYSKRLVVRANRIEHNWGPACDGALLKDLDQSRIEGNLFVRNSVGLYAENSNHNTIANNQFLNNGVAVRVLADSDDNLFTANAFEANTFDVASNSVAASNSTFRRNYWSAYRGYDFNGDGLGDAPYHPVALFTVLAQNYPAAMVLLRSPFAELLDLAERAIPALTPKALVDAQPLMEKPAWSKSATFESASAR
ncbi:MAG TPA: nitrous oxide reductase family maturation protein NosD [Candidatus Binataceae bacterium]|nr:nitrous oxide reductase family maturation protein NosD [Candidatus Binataceae bacterium]